MKTSWNSVLIYKNPQDRLPLLILDDLQEIGQYLALIHDEMGRRSDMMRHGVREIKEMYSEFLVADREERRRLVLRMDLIQGWQALNAHVK